MSLSTGRSTSAIVTSTANFPKRFLRALFVDRSTALRDFDVQLNAEWVLRILPGRALAARTGCGVVGHVTSTRAHVRREHVAEFCRALGGAT